MFVYLEACPDYSPELIQFHIDQILSGHFSGRDLAGKRVFLKVNGLTKATADKAMTTHPTIVEAVACWLAARGCKVVIGDNPAGVHEESWLHAVYRSSGYESAAEKAGARLSFDREIIEKSCDGEKRQSFRMCRMALDCDMLINIAKLKTHEYTRYTGCVKNLYGTLPAEERSELHSTYPEVADFSDMLVDLYECVKPELCILDAVVGMEGPGPSAGDPRQIGAIIASDSGHDADYIGAGLIGMKVSEVKTLEHAARRGLIHVAGDSALNEKIGKMAVKDFKMPANAANTLSGRIPKPIRRFLTNRMKKYPRFDLKTCISCGICVKNCPQGALQMKDKPVFDKKKCICCYCCQEMCPRKAIDLKDTLTSRLLVAAKKLYRKIR